MAGNPPEDRAPYRPHFVSIDGDSSAHEYATRMQDSPMNNNERSARQAQESGNNHRPYSVSVWGHGPDGPSYLGKWDRALPETRKGQAGVLLQHPPGGLPARFMPNEDIHTIEHRPIR